MGSMTLVQLATYSSLCQHQGWYQAKAPEGNLLLAVGSLADIHRPAEDSLHVGMGILGSVGRRGPARHFQKTVRYRVKQ